MTGQNSADAVRCGCKVGRIAEEYDLQSVHDDLPEYWRGDGVRQYSLRELAAYVNREVLRTAMDEAGVTYKDGEVENTYRLLADDDVSSGVRTETRRELEHASVPVDRVERDFVSHQTVYNHLTECLEVSVDEPDADERADRALDKIRALQNRTVAVTDDTLDRLRRHDVLDLGDFNVFVDVTVACEECGTSYTVGQLLEEGTCDCRAATGGEI